MRICQGKGGIFMAADGSIIIDTRINNKGAEADLKALQAKAKKIGRAHV